MRVLHPGIDRNAGELRGRREIRRCEAAARYALNGEFSHEPIEPLNEPLNENILKLVKTHPGVKVPYLHSVVSASRATVKRMVKALMSEGRIEHRGSKKTGGYYLK